MTRSTGMAWADGITWDELPDLGSLPPRAQLVVRRLDTDAGVRLLGWVITLLVGVAFVILLGRGGSTPKDPSVGTNLAPAATVPVRPAPPTGP